MEGRYAFTRRWGAIVSGLGWVILGVQPLGLGLVLVAGAPPHGPAPPWALAAVALMTMVAGVLVGGVFIVAGQRLRLLVDSLHVQLAMLERLDDLVARPASAEASTRGRFVGLAGDGE